MGQKVHPHGLRVGIIKDWDSKWFASKRDFGNNLVEVNKIRTYLKRHENENTTSKICVMRQKQF